MNKSAAGLVITIREAQRHVRSLPHEVRFHSGLYFRLILDGIRDTLLYPNPRTSAKRYIISGTAKDRYVRKKMIQDNTARNREREESKSFIYTPECAGIWKHITSQDWINVIGLLEETWEYIDDNSGETSREMEKNRHRKAQEIKRKLGEFEVR